MIDDLAQIDSPIHRREPRLRVATAAALSVALALADRPAVLLPALAGAVALAAVARLPLRALLRRLGGLALFLAVLAALLPLSVPGPAAWAWGGWTWSRPGLLQAGTIALRASAILLVVTALLSTVPLAGLVWALRRLGLPRTMAMVLVLAVRYTGLLAEEYARLREAMRLRAFRSRPGWHTYRSLACLTGMLLVRSLDRAERVAEAMRLRGFRGELPLAQPPTMSRGDAVFASLAAAALLGLVWGEWL